MRNKIIFGGAVLGFLFLMAFANKAANASTCDPIPSPVDYRGYTIVWQSHSPAIYYNTHMHEAWDLELMLAAEFDSSNRAWLFYKYVPDEVIVQAHRQWRAHRRQYRRCMGYHASFYYQRYHSHYNYRWYQRRIRSGAAFKRHSYHAPWRYRPHRQRHDSYTKDFNHPSRRHHHKRNKRHKKKRHHRRK